MASRELRIRTITCFICSASVGKTPDGWPNAIRRGAAFLQSAKQAYEDKGEGWGQRRR